MWFGSKEIVTMKAGDGSSSALEWSHPKCWPSSLMLTFVPANRTESSTKKKVNQILGWNQGNKK
jgi:hypothetical protein